MRDNLRTEMEDAVEEVRARTMRDSLRTEIQDVLSRYSAENASDTPDYVLAHFLMGCLAAWNEAVRERERWYGRPIPEVWDG